MTIQMITVICIGIIAFVFLITSDSQRFWADKVSDKEQKQTNLIRRWTVTIVGIFYIISIIVLIILN